MSFKSEIQEAVKLNGSALTFRPRESRVHSSILLSDHRLFTGLTSKGDSIGSMPASIVIEMSSHLYKCTILYIVPCHGRGVIILIYGPI